MKLWLVLLLLGFTSHEHGVSGMSSGSGSGMEMDCMLCPNSTQVSSEPTSVPVSPSTSQMFSVIAVSTNLLMLAPSTFAQSSIATSTVQSSSVVSTIVPGASVAATSGIIVPTSIIETISPSSSIAASSTSIDATFAIIVPSSSIAASSTSIDATSSISVPSPSIAASSTSIDATSAIIVPSPSIAASSSTSIDATSAIIVPSASIAASSTTTDATSSIIVPSPSIAPSIPIQLSATTSSFFVQLTSESASSTREESVSTATREMSSSTSPVSSRVITPVSTVAPSVTTAATPLPSVTPPPITTSPPATPSIWDQIREFFTTLNINELSGFIAGGVVVLILSVIVCLCCCCYICKRVRKRRKQRKYNIDTSMTVTNQGVSSMYSNGTTTRLRPPLNSDSSFRDTAHFELNQNQFDGSGVDATRYEQRTWDTPHENERLIGDASVENDVTNGTGPSQPHRSQLSIPGDDVFLEAPLPELTPMTYSSQIFNSSSLHQGLSVDDDPMHGGVRKLSLSGEYMQRIPGGSPSLRHPTRMLKSIESEDTKSAQGSRISMPGSKNSMQGSRPSVFSSQTSFMQSGSRSQMFSSALSNEPISSGANKHREDDTLSLPLSGRTTSPLLSLNSSFEAPTRDEPSGRAAPFLVASHSLGASGKDFASMTSIPNILSPELGTVRVPMDLDPKPESKSESVSSRRLSLINHDLSALTTISDDKPKSEAKKSKELKEAPKKEEETGTPKKLRSRMSRLEMLTSLRASMRKAAKKVSFTKGKKQKENVVLTNDSALSDQETTPTKDNPLRRPSDNSEPSPGDVRGAGRSRAYTDFAAQLSQPNLYYPPMAPHSNYHHPNNYQQLSQSYGFPYPPVQVPIDDPFGHGIPRPPPEFTTRYAGMITPDYSDLTTPDHGRYGNQDGVITPEQYLQHDGSTSDEYPPHDQYPPQSTSSSDARRAVSPSISYTSNEERSTSPDHFPPTSEPYHRSRSPTHHAPGKPLPTVHERYKFDDIPSPDMFPPYIDSFTSPSRRPPPPPGGDHPEFFMEGGAHMYPPPPLLYPGGMPNGYPIPPPRGEYFDDRRRNSLEQHGYNRGLDQMGTFHEGRGSYDRTHADPYHPQQGSYEQAPGDFPHLRPHYNSRREYEQAEHDKRRSVMSDASDLSTASRTRVSWNTEVIEYARTPSDGSDFDLNQL